MLLLYILSLRKGEKALSQEQNVTGRAPSILKAVLIIANQGKLMDFSVALSSNINEFIRAVLNFLFSFYENILHAQKAQKALKSTNSINSAKRHKDTQVKTQNGNKRISDCFPSDVFSSIFYFCSLVSVLCFFCS